MSDEKFAFDKNNIAIGVAASAIATVLLSLAVRDTTRQFGEEVRERYLGLRQRHGHKGKHGHRHDSHPDRPDASYVEQLTARKEEPEVSPRR